jgi:esterase/lipase superfamily enzyme
MKREIRKWWSPNLEKDMEVAVYGHYGYALLMFPTAEANYMEYEQYGLIDSIMDYINSGTLKAFVVNNINSESWLNRHIHPAQMAARQQLYNQYITDEVIPFIKTNCNGEVPVVAAGASLGAFHAANTFFRRPELFAGLIALSGTYSLKEYTDGFFDDNVYYNSPAEFLSNLTDESILENMRNKNIIIASGKGEYEDSQAARDLSGILHCKNISHWLDIWGYDVEHDWPSWKKMLPYFLNNLNI